MKKCFEIFITVYLILFTSLPTLSTGEPGLINNKNFIGLTSDSTALATLEIPKESPIEKVVEVKERLNIDSKKSTSAFKFVPNDLIIKFDENDLVDSVVINLMYAAVYRPEPRQCWGDCTKTADGTHIDIDSLNADLIKFIAVSQDMLARNGGPFRYGDTVYLNIPGREDFTGCYVVHDCMNKRYKKCVDILCPKDKKGNLWRNATLQLVKNRN